MSLALGRKSVEMLSDRIKATLATTSTRHISLMTMLERSGSFSRPASVQSNIGNSVGMMDFVFIEEIQSALEKLAHRVRYGKQFCQQLLVCFKIAMVIFKVSDFRLCFIIRLIDWISI